MKTIIKTTLVALLLGFTINSANAQLSVSISSDVSSLYYGGYAIDGGLNLGKMRYSISLNEYKVPDFININHDSVSKFRKNLDVKISRFLGAEQRGFHYGISTGLVLDETLTLLDSATGLPLVAIPTVGQSYIKVGLSIGYFWHPLKSHKTWKGLYIEPNIGVVYGIGKDDLLLGAKIIEKKPLELDLPRVNIGWKIIF